MAMTTLFDTLYFVKKLKNAGFSEEQAEAISEAFREAHTGGDVATNRDVELMGFRIETRLAETKSELIRWAIGAGFLQTALIAALLLKIVK